MLQQVSYKKKKGIDAIVLCNKSIWSPPVPVLEEKLVIVVYK